MAVTSVPQKAQCDGVETIVGNEHHCLKPMDNFKDCPDCPEMVVVPAGSFTMGSNDNDAEKPPHQITIAKAFGVGKFEVTFAEWDACVASGGCKHRPEDQGWGRGNRPVINVSWDDATKEYLPWLSRKTGKTYRLLTEAEWEYGARSGSSRKYAWGDEVGRNLANWEWVQDCFKHTYAGASSDGSPASEVPECSRVLRGGSWYFYPAEVRAAYRFRDPSVFRGFNIGFRLARTLEP
jgi:formylglycine-generating enzyme required for sulfatase activity